MAYYANETWPQPIYIGRDGFAKDFAFFFFLQHRFIAAPFLPKRYTTFSRVFLNRFMFPVLIAFYYKRAYTLFSKRFSKNRHLSGVK